MHRTRRRRPLPPPSSQRNSTHIDGKLHDVDALRDERVAAHGGGLSSAAGSGVLLDRQTVGGSRGPPPPPPREDRPVGEYAPAQRHTMGLLVGRRQAGRGCWSANPRGRGVARSGAPKRVLHHGPDPRPAAASIDDHRAEWPRMAGGGATRRSVRAQGRRPGRGGEAPGLSAPSR